MLDAERALTLCNSGVICADDEGVLNALAQEFPEADLTAMDAQWYRLASYDAAVVSMNDGTSSVAG